jgi:hypothetical protein
MAGETKRGVWPQRAALVGCGAVLAALWLFARSDRAMINRVFEAGGYVETRPDAPARVGETSGESAAPRDESIVKVSLPGEIPGGFPEWAARVRSLRWLELTGGEVDDADVVPFAGHPALRTVVLDGAHVTDATLRVLRTIPRLEHVSVRRTDVSADGLAAFRKERPNVYIDVDGTTEAGLGSFARLGGVSYSRGSGRYPPDPTPAGGELTLTRAVPSELPEAVAKTEVDRLVLADMRADAEVARIARGRRLRMLTLRNAELTPEAARELSSRPITDLVVERMPLTAELSSILAVPTVERLALTGLKLDGGGPERVDVHARELRVTGTRLPATQIRFVRPTLDRLELDDVELPDGGAALSGLTAREVTARRLKLDAETARALARVATETFRLGNVEFAPGADSELAAAAARDVTLTDLRLTPEGVAALGRLARTESLSLGPGVVIDRDAEPGLAGLRVPKLLLSGAPPSHAVLAALAGTSVSDLTIYSMTKQTPLNPLAWPPKLAKLTLSGEGLDPEAVARFAASVPQVEVEVSSWTGDGRSGFAFRSAGGRATLRRTTDGVAETSSPTP